MWLLFVAACLREVRIETIPAGAVLMAGETRLGSAPVTVEVRTFKPLEVQATLPGYRPMDAKVRSRLLRAEDRVEIRMEEEAPPP